jgi:tetratricopeptide (TPR) repeat protein
MGDIYRTTGPLMAAIEHYQKTIDLLLDPGNQAAIRVKIGRVYNLINDERGIAILEQALEDLDEKKQPLLVSEAWAHLGRYYHYRCQYRLAIEYFEKARELAEPFQDPEPLYYIYAYLAGAYQHMARMKDSLDWAEAAITMGKKMNHLSSIAVGHEFISEDRAIMGYWEKALEAAKTDYDIGKKIGSSNRQSWAKVVGGQALLGMGRLNQAIEELAKGLELATAIGENRLIIWGHALLSIAHSESGNLVKAQEYIDIALERSQKMVELNGHGTVLTASGYFHLNNGDYEQAVELYRTAYDLLQGTDNRDIYLLTAANYAESLLKLGRVEEAYSHLEACLALAIEAPSPRAEGLTQLVFGQYYMMQGDYDKAAEVFDKAIVVLTQIKSRLTLGRVYARRAQMYEDQGQLDLAIQDANMARAIFEECGAARDDLQVKSLLARLE